MAKRATVGARLLARLKTCPGLKMTKDIFYQQVRFDIDLSEELKEQIEAKLDFNRISKNAFKPIALQRYEKDPRFNYFYQCFIDQYTGMACNVLPLLRYITKKTLCLIQYTLSIGHARALAKACELFAEHGVSRVIFDNCGIDDGEMAAIIKGLTKLRNSKRLIYRHNEFGEECLEAI